MKNWRTEKTLYEVHEISRTKHEIYHMVVTGDEMSKWIKKQKCRTRLYTRGWR